MLKVRKVLMVVLAFFAMLCLATGICISRTAYAEAYTFSGTTMAGVQVRLDDDGMRFVMQMNEADYDKYIASKEEGATTKYTAGIIYIPEKVSGTTEIDINTNLVANIVFADDYKATQVVTESGTAYEFYGVATEVPLMSAVLIARGYVTDGSNYYYTSNTVRNTISKVSSIYLNEGSYTDYEEALKENVITAYNEVKGGVDTDAIVGEEDITSFDQITITPVIDAPLTATLISGEDKSPTLVAGEIVGEYTNKVSIDKDIADIIEIDGYTISDSLAGTTSTADTNVVTLADNVLTGKTFGSASVNAMLLGNVVGSQTVNVIDSTIVQSGSNYLASGVYKNESQAAYNLNFAVKLTGTAYNQAFLYHTSGGDSTGKLLTELDGRTATSYRITGISDNRSADHYFNFQPRYTKEQLKLLIDCGYETIKMPIYYQVADDATGLQSTWLNGRDYATVYTPKANITGADVPMGYVDEYSAYVNMNIIRFNQWNTISLSLQTLYDNYKQMAVTTAGMTAFGNSAAGNANRKWAWFGVNLFDNYGAKVAKTAFTKTYYMDDFIATKADSNTLKVDVTSSEIKDSIISSNAFNYVNVNGTVRTHSGVMSGTINGKTGDFIYTTNYQAKQSLTAYTGTIPTQKYISVYMSLGKSLEELQVLKDAGYKWFLVDMCCYGIQDTRSEPAALSIPIKLNKTAKTDGADTSTAKNASQGEYTTWSTHYVSIDNLINYYDNYFVKTDADRWGLFYHSTETAGVTYALYMTNFTFVK